MNDRLVNLSVLAGSLVVAIAIAEAGIRTFGRPGLTPPQYSADSLVVYRLKPNVRNGRMLSRDLDYRWTTNSQGFRAQQDFTVNKSPGVVRILALGDSYTFGSGVDDSATFLALSEARLKGECGVPVEFINAGVGGYNLSQELELYERYARQLNPDVVLLGIMTNDLDDLAELSLHSLRGDSAVPKPVSERPRMIAAKRFAEWMPGYNWLITHSAIVDGLRQLYYGLRLRRLASPDADTAGRDAPPDSVVPLQRALLHRLQARVAEDSAELLVVLMSDEPSARHYLAGEPDNASTVSAMRRLCTELNLQCLDVGDWLSTHLHETDLRTLYIERDGHFANAGHKMLSEIVSPAIRAIIPCRDGHHAPRPDSSAKPSARG